MATKQYLYRPAKAAQRRMIIDACRRLTVFHPLEAYQYVGFGGVEFIDFEHFHLSLGVEKMTSIEWEDSDQDRFKFNKPYESIRLLFGDARDRLAEVDWTLLSIVWLDYTDQLSTDILRDVDYVVRSLVPGSVLIVTVNAGISTRTRDRLPNLQGKLGNYVSPGLAQKDLKGWGAAHEQRRILAEQASSYARSAHGEPIKQLFDFHYADDSKMMTWGGVVLGPALKRTVDHCRFEDLPFIRFEGMSPLLIKMPFLTDREMRQVEHGLPGLGTLPMIKGLAKADIADFRDVYRWRVGTR